MGFYRFAQYKPQEREEVYKNLPPSFIQWGHAEDWNEVLDWLRGEDYDAAVLADHSTAGVQHTTFVEAHVRNAEPATDRKQLDLVCAYMQLLNSQHRAKFHERFDPRTHEREVTPTALVHKEGSFEIASAMTAATPSEEDTIEAENFIGKQIFAIKDNASHVGGAGGTFFVQPIFYEDQRLIEGTYKVAFST